MAIGTVIREMQLSAKSATHDSDRRSRNENIKWLDSVIIQMYFKGSKYGFFLIIYKQKLTNPTFIINARVLEDGVCLLLFHVKTAERIGRIWDIQR